MLKWHFYNKEPYNEIYFRGDTPRSFSEWETVLQATTFKREECIYWLSPNAFVNEGGYETQWLSSVTGDKKNFPQCYFLVITTSKLLNIWATTESEAFRTLYEMTLYHDFAASFKGIHHTDNTSIKLPTMLLKEMIEKATNPLGFKRIHFQSSFASRVLAQSDQSTSVTLDGCAFGPPAEEAFVDGILSKTDRNSGLTGLLFVNTFPFSSEHCLIRLMMSGNGPTAFSYLFPDAPYSEEVLDSLRNSQRLQSLELCRENFTSNDAYASFVRSLNSTSLRSLTIQDWDMRENAFPVEIFEKLALTHFTLLRVSFHEAGWRNLLQEIAKCRTLMSLEFKYISWRGLGDEELAGVGFALELAQFLKDNPNILATNTKFYFCNNDEDDADADNDDILYTTHLAPILEHNRLIKNLRTLKEKANYEVRGFLVAEAVGTRFAGDLSSCYTMLKANVDILVSYLSSRHLPRAKKRNICFLHN